MFVVFYFGSSSLLAFGYTYNMRGNSIAGRVLNTSPIYTSAIVQPLAVTDQHITPRPLIPVNVGGIVLLPTSKLTRMTDNICRSIASPLQSHNGLDHPSQQSCGCYRRLRDDFLFLSRGRTVQTT